MFITLAHSKLTNTRTVYALHIPLLNWVDTPDIGIHHPTRNIAFAKETELCVNVAKCILSIHFLYVWGSWSHVYNVCIMCTVFVFRWSFGDLFCVLDIVRFVNVCESHSWGRCLLFSRLTKVLLYLCAIDFSRPNTPTLLQLLLLPLNGTLL